MVDHNKIAELVQDAMDCIGWLTPKEVAPEQMADLETLESYGWGPVDCACRQMETSEDNPRDVSRSEFQAVWETVDAKLRAMAEQRARDLYAIMSDE